MGYRHCKLLDDLSFIVNGRVDVPGAPVLSMCCEMIQGMPRIPFQGPPQELLQNFLGLGMAMKLECAHISDDRKRRFTAGCLHCARFTETEEVQETDARIHHVNISSYPAPCQSHCFYCWVHDWDERFTPAAKEGYELMFNTLELASHCGLIAEDALWNVASGEIAIHPYHDRIMNLSRGKKTRFLTNCMKFDDSIAQNLHDCPDSSINLSIDSGTPQTWMKVKGVDNFGLAMENLSRYYAASGGRPGQITLKYIIFPGINDNYEDFISLIEIMKVIEVKSIMVSRDGRVKYNAEDEYRRNLIGATAYLLAMCQRNDMTVELDPFSLQERTEIKKLAEEILYKGLI